MMFSNNNEVFKRLCINDPFITFAIVDSQQTKASGSLAAQKSASIFDSESTQFKYTLYGGLGLFGFLFIIGIIWEYLNSQSRRRRYSIAETEEPKGWSSLIYFISSN